MVEYIATVVILPVVLAVLASSGFWAFIQKRGDRNDAKTRMLVGIGHDRIMYLCMRYIERGYITDQEYDSLHNYLYLPYQDLGGNGAAKRLMAEVDKLPVRSSNNVQVEEEKNGIDKQGLRRT